jgi:hypothetical protein
VSLLGRIGDKGEQVLNEVRHRRRWRRGDILAGRASVSADQKRVGNQLFLTHYNSQTLVGSSDRQQDEQDEGRSKS